MENAILKYLSEKPIKRRDLLYLLRQEQPDLSDRAMRKEIELMVTEHGYCIESSEKGYTLITDLAGLDRALTYLDKKAASIAIRKNYLVKNFRALRGATSNQLELIS